MESLFTVGDLYKVVTGEYKTIINSLIAGNTVIMSRNDGEYLAFIKRVSDADLVEAKEAGLCEQDVILFSFMDGLDGENLDLSDIENLIYHYSEHIFLVKTN